MHPRPLVPGCAYESIRLSSLAAPVNLSAIVLIRAKESFLLYLLYNRPVFALRDSLGLASTILTARDHGSTPPRPGATFCSLRYLAAEPVRRIPPPGLPLVDALTAARDHDAPPPPRPGRGLHYPLVPLCRSWRWAGSCFARSDAQQSGPPSRLLPLVRFWRCRRRMTREWAEKKDGKHGGARSTTAAPQTMNTRRGGALRFAVF